MTQEQLVLTNTPLSELGAGIHMLALIGPYDRSGPVPGATRSKAWVCSRSLAGITGSNPTGDMDVCLL